MKKLTIIILLLAFRARAEGLGALGGAVETVDGGVQLSSGGDNATDKTIERKPLGASTDTKPRAPALEEEGEPIVWPVSPSSSRVRLINVDVSAARRGVLETLFTLMLAPVPGAIYAGACWEGCETGVTVIALAGTLLFTGAVAALIHDVAGGQGQLGAGVVGSLLGGLVSITAVLLALGAGSPALLVVALLASSIAPSVGAIIGLETDNSNRREALGQATTAPILRPARVALAW